MHPLKSDATIGPTELQLDTRRQSVATQLDVITFAIDGHYARDCCSGSCDLCCNIMCEHVKLGLQEKT